MFQTFSNRSILFLFLNSLVITCHSILGIMGKIVVPRQKEGKNYSILLVNAFLFYTGIIGCHRNYADLHMLIVNLEQYSFKYVTFLSNLYRVLMYVFHSLSVPFH